MADTGAYEQFLLDQSLEALKQGDVEVSYSFAASALRTCTTSRNRHGQATAHVRLATSYMLGSNFAQASQHAARGRGIFVELGDAAGAHEGQLYEICTRAPQAQFETLAKLERELRRGEQDAATRYSSLIAIGISKVLRADDKVQGVFSQALELVSPMDNPSALVAHSSRALAAAISMLRRFPEVLDVEVVSVLANACNQASRYLRECSPRELFPGTLRLMLFQVDLSRAVLYAHLGNLQSARELLQKCQAQALAKEVPAWNHCLVLWVAAYVGFQEKRLPYVTHTVGLMLVQAQQVGFTVMETEARTLHFRLTGQQL